MADKKLALTLTPSQREHFHKQLGYVRCWIQGFEAAGKAGPHAVDTLRQIQVWLGEAK